MNQNKFTIEIPDLDYWKKQIKCQDACPVLTDAKGYVRAIAQGDAQLACRIARAPNPLASVCGRVCQAPCEEACRRANIDHPIAIRALKRFATERFGAEANLDKPDSVIESVRMIASANSGIDELSHIIRAQSDGKQPPAGSEKVAIIGGGPAGLGCAHDLALLGFSPVIFEVEDKAAGMLYTGIPEFRLPREVLTAEIDVIKSLGVEIRCNMNVGKDIRFDEILRDFSATVIAVGAKNSKSVGIPGEDANGVFGGVEFLRKLSLGRDVALGKHVMVIGGGFTALDCSRTSIRSGASDVVTVLYRRTRDEMPATQHEIDEAATEGVAFEYLITPLSIEKDAEGQVTGLRLQKNRLGPPDSSGRRSPQPIPGSEFVKSCDTVILAIGQESDLAFVNPARDGLSFNEWGLIDCDEDSLATNVPGIFLAGDAAYGTKRIIDAVASGKKAARSVYQHLTGRSISTDAKPTHYELESYERETGYEGIPRVEIPMVDKERRIKDRKAVVEVGYDETTARQEAGRCLDCGVNTIFHSERCILCGGCADICPETCLRLVSLDNIEDDETLATLYDKRYGQEPEGTASTIIKDEDRCIRCGLCAERCPVNAITMERFLCKEEWK